MNITKAISALAVAAAISVSAFAQKDVKKNAELVADIKTANSYEVSLLELVSTKAHNAEFKDMAVRMLSDHRVIADQLNQYAEHQGIGPEGKVEENSDKMEKWNKKPAGLEWDADALETLTDLHKDELDVLQKAEKETEDAELKSWVASTMPILRNHVEMLNSMKSKIKKPWKEENRPSPDMNSNKKQN